MKEEYLCSCPVCFLNTTTAVANRYKLTILQKCYTFHRISVLISPRNRFSESASYNGKHQRNEA